MKKVFCLLFFLCCLILAIEYVAPIYQWQVMIVGSVFLCTGMLIECLEDLFKKYFDKDNNPEK